MWSASEQGVTVNGAAVTLPGGRESPYNAVASNNVVTAGSKTTFGFHVTNTNGSPPFVGVCPPSQAQATGYGMKMIGFGGPGNLVGAGGCKSSSWGSIPDAPYTVNVTVEVGAGGKVRMWLGINGSPLGKAFDVTDAQFSSGVIPVVHGQNCTVTLQTNQPAIGENRTPAPGGPTKFIITEASQAALKQACGVGANENVVKTTAVILGDGGVSVKVCNSFRCSMENGTVGVGSSTLMAPIGKNADIERKVKEILSGATLERPSPQHVIVRNGGHTLEFEEDTSVPCVTSL